MNQRLLHIGMNVRLLREYRNLTQEQLAEKADLRTATVSDVENGKQNFEIETLIRIAGALNCYLDISFTPVEQV